MKSKIRAIILILIFGSVLKADSQTTLNFNTCAVLSKSDRDSCLLGLSQKLEALNPKTVNNGHIEAKFTFRDGMWTNNDDLNNVDQSFHISLTPEISYLFDHGQIISASWTLNQGSLSSAEEPATKYYGRPQLVALFPMTHKFIEWKLGGGIRPPAGSSPQFFGNFQSPIPLDRVWELSLQTTGIVTLPNKWSITAFSGIFYNTEYDYKFTAPSIDESFFDQWPIISKSSLIIQKNLGTIQLGLGYVGQFGFAGRQIIGGDPNYTNQGNEIINLPGARDNAVQFSFEADLGSKLNLGIKLLKTLASLDGEDARLYANPDDPSLSSNLSASASLAKGF